MEAVTTKNTSQKHLSFDDVIIEILLGAMVITVIAVMPYLNILNALLGIGVILGGYSAAKIISMRHSTVISRQQFFFYSALAASIGGLVSVILTTVILNFTGYDVTQKRSEMLVSTIMYAQGIKPSQNSQSKVGGFRMATETGERVNMSNDEEDREQNASLIPLLLSLSWTIPLYATLGGIGGLFFSRFHRR